MNLLVVILILLVFTNNVFGQNNTATLSKEIFKNPNPSAKPLTWWHWINGNVTKDGIKKDLIDMKRVGIGGVQMFDTHMYLPKGPIRYGSDAWFDHVHYAMRLCDSLGLEFYITNSPGWSGAGGPWITLEKSMKQLVYSETAVHTNQTSFTLNTPYTKNGFYREIAVIAVSTTKDEIEEIKEALVSVTDPTTHNSLKNLIDEKEQTYVPFKKGETDSMSILFEFKSKIDINSLNISLSAIKGILDFKGSLAASFDGKTYEQVATYSFTDHQAATANFTIPFLAAGIKWLRLTINDPKKQFNINEIKLQNLYGLKNWAARTGMTKSSFLTEELALAKEENNKALSAKEIINLSKFYDASTGLVKWNPPVGKWTILRFGYTTTGKTIHPAVDEGTGYEVDKLDPEAITFQFNNSLGRVIKEAGNLTGKTFKGILFDSFEGGFQNWTANFPQMFEEKNNYDITSYLPVLTGRTIESKVKTSVLLWDFQQTLTQLFAENYYGKMQELAHQYKLQTFSESQGGPMSPAYANAYVDVPMNEFWTDGIQLREKLIKQTVSIANILGKTIVGAEAFTSKPEFGKWQNTPETMKAIGDYAFTAGINRFIFHTYVHQPYNIAPGFTMGRYGTEFGRTNTWWKYAGNWINYISRSQYLLQQGHVVAEVCYLFPKDAVYEFPPNSLVLPKGYNFDIIYPPYLKDLIVKGSTMTLKTGPSYKLMLLPQYPFMDFETLQAIQNLLKDGAIMSGSPPIAAPNEFTAAKKERFDQLVKEIWAGLDGKSTVAKNYGKGKIYWGKSTEEILTEMNLKPDFQAEGKTTDSLRYIHKKLGDQDFYLVSNQSNQNLNFSASFRNSGKQPEIWDAESGKTYAVPVFDVAANTTQIPLNLTPKGALFIVFSEPLTGRWIKNITTQGGNNYAANLNSSAGLFIKEKETFNLNFSDGHTQTLQTTKSEDEVVLKGPWTLNFLDGRGAPSNYKMDHLVLWQQIKEPSIKYYSGTVAYQNQFTLTAVPSTEKVILDFGELYDIAEVFVNGISAGIIWKKPYQIEVSKLIKKGDNELQIVVANKWINRLIGDEFITTDLKYDSSTNKFTTGKLVELPTWVTNPIIKRTDARLSFTTWKHYSTASTLVNSGLKGPIKLIFYQQINLKP